MDEGTSKGDNVTKLSDHVRKYNSLSNDMAKNFLAALKRCFVVGAEIDESGQEWLFDYAEGMTALYEKCRSEAKAIKTERDKLEKRTVDLTSKLDMTVAKLESIELENSRKKAPEEESRDSQEMADLELQLPLSVDNQWNLPNVRQINLKSLVKKLRYFDGESPLPREWIEEYKDAMEDNCWSDQTAIYYFKHFLQKDAATWFKLTVRPMVKSNWLWPDLFEVFEQNYLGRAGKDRIKRLLRELKMKQEDRAANFIPRVRQYLLMMSPDLSEEDQVSNIKEKLKPEYATAIVENDPETVDELRDICRRVEAARDLRKLSTQGAGQDDQKMTKKRSFGVKPFQQPSNLRRNGSGNTVPNPKVMCRRKKDLVSVVGVTHTLFETAEPQPNSTAPRSRTSKPRRRVSRRSTKSRRKLARIRARTIRIQK